MAKTIGGYPIPDNARVRGTAGGKPVFEAPSKEDVGLGNCDNTADANKPVSSAQQTALDAKVTANGAITGATKRVVTYDSKGLVTAGADPVVGTSSPSNPTGTTNTTGVMMGLAGAFTPTTTGRVLIAVTGTIQNGLLAATSTVQMRTGTGTAPANGDALTGTTRGTAKNYVAPTTAAKTQFTLSWIVTGLTPNTAIWIDVGLSTSALGTATISDVDIAAVEV